MISSALSIGLLVIGLVLGLLLGWFARSSQQAKSEQDNPPVPLIDAVNASLTSSLTPLYEGLSQLNGKIHSLDVERAETMASLASQVQTMTRTSVLLSDRTNKLVSALRAPQTRGRWGELQLERVVELAGMQKYCDFDTQVSTTNHDKTLRPDMVINLSGGRTIIVDAKAPFTAYLDALETTDPEEHEGFLRRHAYQLRQHVTQLSKKNYTSGFSTTPEFVILFVPADPFLDAALVNDRDLLEYAFSRNIVLATPSTLIVLLRTIAMGWQQQSMTDQAATVQKLGKELYSRLTTLADHYDRVGKSLDKAVDAYNSALASWDSRVMVTAQKLADLDVVTPGSKTISSAEPITRKSRTPRNYDDVDAAG